MLFVLDHKDKKFTWIDPTSTPEWCKDMPYKKYVRAILDMSIKYMSAMRVYDQKWSQNIFTWKAKSADGIVEDKEGYIVLQYMAVWKHVRTTPICVVRILCFSTFMIHFSTAPGWTSTEEEFCD